MIINYSANKSRGSNWNIWEETNRLDICKSKAFREFLVNPIRILNKNFSFSVGVAWKGFEWWIQLNKCSEYFTNVYDKKNSEQTFVLRKINKHFFTNWLYSSLHIFN